MVNFDRLPEQQSTTDFDRLPHRSSLMLDTVLLGEPTQTDKNRRKDQLEAEVLKTGLNYIGPQIETHVAYLSDDDLADKLGDVMDRKDPGKTLVRVTVEYEVDFDKVTKIFQAMQSIYTQEDHELLTQKIIAAEL